MAQVVLKIGATLPHYARAYYLTCELLAHLGFPVDLTKAANWLAGKVKVYTVDEAGNRRYL